MEISKISTLSRVLLFICGLGLILVLFKPIWRIELQAPQYPEGLNLFIHASKLSGNVDIINGLNHYIGMKKLNEDDFIEFKVLPAIIIFFTIFFIVVSIVAKRKLMNLLFSLFVFFGIIAMTDFWRWEYEYGHELDPNAAIIVPDMAYQPPLIGFKQLLNFGAYSIPDMGGLIFIAAGLLLLFSVIYENQKAKKKRLIVKKSSVTVAVLSIIFLSGCNVSPDPIAFGKDNCHFCKMTISDGRFGGEVVSKKTKTYKFDDSHCILAFIRSNTVKREDIAGIYFLDFADGHDFVRAEDAFFLQSPDLKSPMNGNIAAFKSEDSLHGALPTFYGNKTSWEDMQK
jgi:copper chaperone NosL